MVIFSAPMSSSLEPIFKSFNAFPLFSVLSLSYNILQIRHETITADVISSSSTNGITLGKIAPLIHSIGLKSQS